MKGDFKENFAYSIAFTFVLAVLLASALSSLYTFTADQVKLNQQEQIARATLTAIGEPIGDQPVEQYRKIFNAAPGEVHGVTEISLNGQQILVTQFIGSGLWDHISGIMAVTKDLQRIVGLTIIEQKETPGLGGRIEEPFFQEQFTGEKIGQKISMIQATEAGGDTNKENSAFDSISGATLTSRAFEVIVNDTLQALREAK